MHRPYPIAGDFEATIRILAESEGGRESAVFNGIRWDFSYASDEPPAQLYMIHPDFLDAGGNSLRTDSPLPVGVDLPARMTVIVDEMREQTHRARIKPGVEFYCHEGARRVAVGRVTRITGLHDVRA